MAVGEIDEASSSSRNGSAKDALGSTRASATGVRAADETVSSAREPKSIILFSDGTGNSSGKLFKTNVWRLYEAVDLGPSSAGMRDQIAYYDNGVGTSAFKPLAVLSGIFGFGLKRNVLRLYRFACRNYRAALDPGPGIDIAEAGDHLYGFGFSRGAFTIRLLIALIADQGLVPYESEAQLLRDSAAAYRKFRVGKPRYGYASPAWLLISGLRLLASALRFLLQVPRYDPSQNHRPAIKFVGVWDTVAAYGGPITELTRAIDNWVYRLSMPDHHLHKEVQRARHALALDDERDSFQPLLWDECYEESLIHSREAGLNPELGEWINEQRLEQVWFCGMHSDVGGGYPDESLSYVSLLWMLEEAQNAQLRTLDIITDRYRALANSFGPIHDSRAGVGAYYRYQPRNISVWLQPIDDSTLSLRDPAIRDDNGPHGLLTSVKIHESVVARIASGTDRYAPFALPDKFLIHPPGRLAENRPQPTSECAKLKETSWDALLDPVDRQRMEDPARTSWARRRMVRVWDTVWLRRFTYFATLGATLLLLAMPLWIGLAPEQLFLSDGRAWIRNVIGLVGAFAPKFLRSWIRVYQHAPFYTLILGLVIPALLSVSGRLELRLRDRARLAWHEVINARAVTDLPGPEPSTIRERIRTSRAYQRTLQFTKWHLLPGIIGIAIILAGLGALLAMITQITLPFYERASRLCPRPTGEQRLVPISRDFDTRATCNPMKASVEAKTPYNVSFYVVDDWKDSDVAASPAGVGAASYPFGLGLLGTPLKRVVDAGYLQPVIEVREMEKPHTIIPKIFMYPLKLKRDRYDASLYRGRFTAAHSGDLFLFANDSVLPFFGAWAHGYDLDYFYKLSGSRAAPGNHGTACVIIAPADAASSATAVRPDSPACLRAAAAVRQSEAASAQTSRRPANLHP